MLSARSVLNQSTHLRSYCRRVCLKAQTMTTNQVYWSQNYSTGTMPVPHIEGSEKQFPQKIVQLVQDISKLNLIEVADLNELLKKTLNIQDAPMMSMGMSEAAPIQEEDEEQIATKKEKVIFTVKLTKFDEGKKIQLIKAIKGIIPNLNLVQAKKFVESVPQIVQSDVSKDEAEKLKADLEALGGVAEIE